MSVHPAALVRLSSPEPYVKDTNGAPPYLWTREMAGYGLPLEDVPGIATPEDLKVRENAARMGVRSDENASTPATSP